MASVFAQKCVIVAVLAMIMMTAIQAASQASSPSPSPAQNAAPSTYCTGSLVTTIIIGFLAAVLH
ncbi:hypothetical protein KP509_09G013300 [Ceratopteris richardii]|uniref:Uncharacterized protein n=1 Tax=Ceratopteris richardii TaxID=49495 RepID=A0A8T2U4Z8_CERRI|nr:hypothetical protein KP509_09G013300 [Ceratopteris richardii]